VASDREKTAPASRPISQSATLAINERLASRRAAGQRTIPLGFGEAGLPVLPAVAEILAGAAGHNAYGPVAGSVRARSAAAGYFVRRGLPTAPAQVILSPGSKAILFALLAVLPGDVVLPQPSWVTYAAQATLVGKRVVGVPIPPGAGGVPDPDLLEHALRTARADGADPRIMILTLPDNPTGTVPDNGLVQRVCAVAERHGFVIISDEIYRDLAFHQRDWVSPAAILPERTVVTGGLSKNMALGGWRIGFARIPANEWGHTVTDRVIGVASEVWSCQPAPMQEAAAFVLDEPAAVVDHVSASRGLHRAIVLAVHRQFVDTGALCREPQAAFYLYPDLEHLRPILAGRGVRTGAELAEYLLERHGIGVLAGEAFGDDPIAYRFRVATSLLYGNEDQRWAALRDAEPAKLPWIASALTDLRAALTDLAERGSSSGPT
jgi:aspartate aminotransferase